MAKNIEAGSSMDDKAVGLPDAKDALTDIFSTGGLVTFVEERFTKSEESRRSDETRWLRAYRNYRGLYGPDVKFTETEKSRVFVKVTKTKTLAAYGQITDVLFANNTFPLSIEPTTLPEGVAESVHFDTDPNMQKVDRDIGGLFGYKGDGKDFPAGATATSLMDALGPLKESLQDLDVKNGPGATPTSITFHPAMVAAKRMQKKIMDQLEESNANKQLRSTAFEMSLFGTGIMKGPFAVDKEYAKWDEEGTYNPLIKTMPQTSHVSVWNFYPDPDAANMDDAAYCIERHKMTRSQLRALKNRPMFRPNVINQVIEEGENYVKKYWEDDLNDYTNVTDIERFEVFEYWGVVDVEMLERNDIDIPKAFKDASELQANIWICGGKILRLVLNPFKPVRIPYYAVPYELNPYSFFGVGIAENMDDTQTLMNGFMRLSVDNAVLSGNLVFEVDETNLVPGQDLTIYPGKVFRRQGGAPGQAIFGTKFPNVSQENLQMFDKARQLADESTGLPSFAHGQTGIGGVGRTASGISMLMNAASGGIKTVIKNVDDYLLRPMGEAFFSFNMQFDYDPEAAGDLEVKARGTESLMQNEVRSQRLLQFLQVVQNPMLAPFAKMPYIIREIAKSMDLDPDLVANNMDEAARMALTLQSMQPPTAPVGAPPAAGGPPPVSDMTGGGGGNIGVGAVATPGEQGFSGAPAAPQ
tara:strand:+ start:2831 stop:4921 length:2091 start_codon:yes stop_codon:yes gene_type:complete